MPTEISPNTLRPLPCRITQRQYLRLVARRTYDQLAIQEHVRRALDMYLDALDRRRGGPPPGAASEAQATEQEASLREPAAPPPPHGQAAPPVSAASPAVKSRSKLAMR